MTVRIYSFSKCCELLRDVLALQPDTATDRSVAFLMTSPTERSSRGWRNDEEETGTGRQEPSVTSGKQANSLLCSRVIFTAGNLLKIHTRHPLDFSPISHLKYCHYFMNVCPLSPPTHACVPYLAHIGALEAVQSSASFLFSLKQPRRVLRLLLSPSERPPQTGCASWFGHGSCLRGVAFSFQLQQRDLSPLAGPWRLPLPPQF